MTCLADFSGPVMTLPWLSRSCWPVAGSVWGTPALRKYLLTMMSVASWDHCSGISASVISKTTDPSGLEMRLVRFSYLTDEKGSCPWRVNLRAIFIAQPSFLGCAGNLFIGTSERGVSLRDARGAFNRTGGMSSGGESSLGAGCAADARGLWVRGWGAVRGAHAKTLPGARRGATSAARRSIIRDAMPREVTRLVPWVLKLEASLPLGGGGPGIKSLVARIRGRSSPNS